MVADRDPTPVEGDEATAAGGGKAPAAVPKLSLEVAPQSTPADADRAAGSSPRPVVPTSGAANGVVESPKAQDPASLQQRGQNHGQWAQALGLPVGQPPQQSGAATARVPEPRLRGSAELRGDCARRTAASAEPPAVHGDRHRSGTSGAGPALSARTHTAGSGSSGAPRRHSDHHSVPRNSAASGGPQPTPRRRSPVQHSQALGYGTPRGPMQGPPGTSATPSRGGSSTTTYRSRTPGKRPEVVSARESASTRPGTSQGSSAPSRPSGVSTARQPGGEARRRHYSMAFDSAPSSARGQRTGSGGGSSGCGSSSVAAAAAVAADLYGSGAAASSGLSSSMRGMGPSSAWTTVRPPHSGSGARASSASPEVGSGGFDAGFTGPPLSAREARDEAMRTCRGAFNVSCTSSKPPKHIMQEMHRALTLHRIAYKQTTSFLVKCQKQGLRFEMEISHLDHLESIYVVRFRRAAGELAAYKELCSKILAEMKI